MVHQETKLIVKFDELEKSFDENLDKNFPTFGFLDLVVDGRKHKELVLIDPTKKLKPKDTKTHIIQDRGGLVKMKIDAEKNPNLIYTNDKFKIYKGK